MTTKTRALEKADDLKRRIDDASKIVPLTNLASGPSTVLGNKLTIQDQVAKSKLIVEVAKDIWGFASFGAASLVPSNRTPLCS